ncbi:MAG: hypothetical protein N2Z21_06535 [Candidatus Sumerlaeaceae bacterium]|nr:hypothetical protein [Candidatus Sumerlaeaceae bacterium]
MRRKWDKVLRLSDWACALFITGAALFARVWLSVGHPAYRPNDPTAFFPAEAGMQFRWAQLVAENGNLPACDHRAQWPEGLCMSLDIAPLMEYVAGWTFRLLPWKPSSFFDYAIIFVATFSALSAAAAYVTVRFLRGGVAGALFAAAVSGFYPAVVARVIRNFGRENFSLIFVILPIILLLFVWQRTAAQRSSSRLVACLILASLFQGLAFASWHMARPIFELHAAAILLFALLGGVSSREQRIASAWFLSCSPWWFGLPLLQVRSYSITPNLVALLVIAITLILAQKPTHRLFGWAVAFLGWLCAQQMQSVAEDSHVAEVLLAKLRHGFVKPLNPQLLSPEARLMWIEAFNSPALTEILGQATPVVAVASLLAVLGRRRICALWRRDAAWRGIVVLFFAWSIAYLLFQRLVLLFSFGVSVVLGLALSESLRSRKRLTAFALSTVVLLPFASYYVDIPIAAQLRHKLALRSSSPSTRFENRMADTRDVLQWLRTHTSRDDVIVAWFGLSSQIYAYADRPVVVQSKFENPYIRPKVLHLAQALVSQPSELAGFCRRYGASYLVYEATMVLHQGTESFRYVAGCSRIATTSSIALLHFWPHELRDFRLVYQNRSFRVFEVLGDRPARAKQTHFGWFPLYDRQWCGVTNSSGELDDDALARAVERASDMENRLIIAQVLASEAKLAEALRVARTLLAQEPRFWQAAVLMARIYARAGNWEAAKNACRAAEIGYPHCPDLPLYLANPEREELP